MLASFCPLKAGSFRWLFQTLSPLNNSKWQTIIPGQEFGLFIEFHYIVLSVWQNVSRQIAQKSCSAQTLKLDCGTSLFSFIHYLIQAIWSMCDFFFPLMTVGFSFQWQIIRFMRVIKSPGFWQHKVIRICDSVILGWNLSIHLSIYSLLWPQNLRWEIT